MSLELKREQLEAAGKGPVTVTDPETQQTYMVVRKDVFDELLNEDALDMRTVGRLVNEAMAEDDAQDPWLESYQQFRKPS